MSTRTVRTSTSRTSKSVSTRRSSHPVQNLYEQPPSLVEERRREISQQARREWAEYDKMKDLVKKRTNVTGGTATLGGTVSLEEARQRQLADVKAAPLRKKLAEEERKRVQKETQNREVEAFKQRQRSIADAQQQRRQQGHVPPTSDTQ